MLRYKLVELSFEAPQVAASWVVLVARLSVDEIAWASAAPPPLISDWAKVGQIVSAAFGLLSLALGLTDFLRVHPRSYWARASPPSRLFLGLVDVSPRSWLPSLLVGAWAFLALTTRALVATEAAVVTLNRAHFDARYSGQGDAAAALREAAAKGFAPTVELPAGMPRSQYQAYDW